MIGEVHSDQIEFLNWKDLERQLNQDELFQVEDWIQQGKLLNLADEVERDMLTSYFQFQYELDLDFAPSSDRMTVGQAIYRLLDSLADPEIRDLYGIPQERYLIHLEKPFHLESKEKLFDYLYHQYPDLKERPFLARIFHRLDEKGVYSWKDGTVGQVRHNLLEETLEYYKGTVYRADLDRIFKNNLE